MLPGMANNPALANVKVDEKQIARKRAIVLSMTPEERENPDLLTPSRRRRIANGSGNTFIEVNKFIKDFNQAKQMMQGIMSGDMEQMMRQMGLNPNNLPKTCQICLIWGIWTMSVYLRHDGWHWYARSWKYGSKPNAWWWS